MIKFELMGIIHQVPDKKLRAFRRARNRFNALRDDMCDVFDLVTECIKYEVDIEKFCIGSSKNTLNSGFEIYSRPELRGAFVNKFDGETQIDSYSMKYDGKFIECSEFGNDYKVESIEDAGISAHVINRYCDSFELFKKNFIQYIKLLEKNEFDY